jgi:hypothetical protein
LEGELARIADAQHGVVARWQLLMLGFSADQVKRRVRSARLHRVQSGVYAVGRRGLTKEGQWMAAVLAGGQGAVLSDRDAAAAHALLRAEYGPIHVTTPRKLVSRDGLRFHHRHLLAAELTAVEGIPTTTVARTIVDLAATEPRRVVERAIHEAEVQRTLDLRALEAIVDRWPHSRGIRAIRAILADRSLGSASTKEELEDAFVAFLDEEGFPHPQTNAWIQIGERWFQVDCLWRAQRLIVELDGWQVHGTRRRFETDRERDRALLKADWRPIRVTWRHLHGGRRALAGDLRELLGCGQTASRRRAS